MYLKPSVQFAITGGQITIDHFPELNGSQSAIVIERQSFGMSKQEMKRYDLWEKAYSHWPVKDKYLESVKRWQEFIIDGIRIQGFERFLSDDVFHAIHEEINRVVYTYCR